jgi:hypothetical protein
VALDLVPSRDARVDDELHNLAAGSMEKGGLMTASAGPLGQAGPADEGVLRGPGPQDPVEPVTAAAAHREAFPASLLAAGEPVADRALDRLSEETDRQLEELWKEANSIAARAGLLMSVVAIAATIDAVNAESITSIDVVAFLVLGVAAIVGVAAAFPSAKAWVDHRYLAGIYVDITRSTIANSVLRSRMALVANKMLVLQINTSAVAAMTKAFYVQVAVTIPAVLLAVMAIAKG